MHGPAPRDRLHLRIDAFALQIREANGQLTLAGAIVLAPGETRLVGDGALSMEQQAKLDALHRQRIDLADRVLVVNQGGYLGESTRSEIDYARAMGKPVSLTEPQ